MVISHQYKFIFVRTRKTASTSVEIALSQILGNQDIITPFCPRDEKLRAEWGGKGPQNYLESWTRYKLQDIFALLIKKRKKMRFYNHMSSKDIKNLIGEEIWNSYFKFCFERNPWDKVISLYYHRYKTEPRPAFSEFFVSGEYADAFNYHLYTCNDEVVMDFIGRYENLEEDFKWVCNNLKFPTVPTLPRAKSQFRKDRRHYRTVLSQEHQNMIANTFSKEIILFPLGCI